MAAPVLHAKEAAAPSSLAAKRNADGATDDAAREEPDTPRSFVSDSSSGLDTPTERRRGTYSCSFTDATGTMILIVSYCAAELVANTCTVTI